MTQAATVLSHLRRTKTMSIREAMDDYGLSGGGFTKVISNLKKAGHNIERSFRKHPVTGRRYARYYLLEDVKQDAEPVAVPAAVPVANLPLTTTDGLKVGDILEVVTQKSPSSTFGMAARVGATAVITGFPNKDAFWCKGKADPVTVQWIRDGKDDDQCNGDYFINCFKKLT